ncbi:hypothetical protein, partial [Siminovitchia fordii]|uniref:hypothetical protein n=1 Tax=Siminovitchia fordii TaxID=254759 RepID=UPI001BB433FC
ARIKLSYKKFVSSKAGNGYYPLFQSKLLTFRFVQFSKIKLEVALSSSFSILSHSQDLVNNFLK